ncbi:MAG: STAS domain-containing protein [Chthonomonadales bacterium]|nr:STAS domain-containing protein [Chthonomonadales bacterium]
MTSAGGAGVEFTVERINSVVLVVIKGDRLDANNSNIFKRAMEPVLAGSAQAVIDLGAVRFMDSSGLGALLSCLRRMNAAGGALRLAALQRPVRAVMEMVRMHRVFDIYDTRDAALSDAEKAGAA